MLIENVLSHFNIEGNVVTFIPWGNGHINETYLVTTDKKQYILQKINTTVFPQADLMMDNILAVTEFIKEKLISENKYSERHALFLIKTKENKHYLSNELGFWRIYNYITDSISLDKIDNPSHFYQGGVGFGNFQNMLKDYPADTLHETIKDFHNTPVRFENFKKAVANDVLGRKKLVVKEIDFFLEREDFYSVLTDKLAKKEIPLRVTHNDTKLNNVMLDKKTLEPLCVIDLDTVMPGLSVYDFGDSIRFGASTALEDETDLDKVELDLELYEAFTGGFLKGLEKNITAEEIFNFPIGAKMMTIECGMRFLADYLNGDTYFKISRENHNLDRARTQIKLVQETEKKYNQIKLIIEKFMI